MDNVQDFKIKKLKEEFNMKLFKSFIFEDDGMGTIEIAILIAALVALAIVFRKQLAAMWTSIRGTLDTQTQQIDDNPFEATTK